MLHPVPVPEGEAPFQKPPGEAEPNQPPGDPHGQLQKAGIGRAEIQDRACMTRAARAAAFSQIMVFRSSCCSL